MVIQNYIVCIKFTRKCRPKHHIGIYIYANSMYKQALMKSSTHAIFSMNFGFLLFEQILDWCEKNSRTSLKGFSVSHICRFDYHMIYLFSCQRNSIAHEDDIPL